MCLVQTGRVPFQIYMNQPFLLFPEGLDAIQPQRIITGVDGVILPLPGDQLIPQPFVQCFIHLILIIRLVLDDLVRGTAAGCVLIFFLYLCLQQGFLLAKRQPACSGVFRLPAGLLLHPLFFLDFIRLGAEGGFDFHPLLILPRPFFLAEMFGGDLCLENGIFLPHLVFLPCLLQRLPTGLVPLDAAPVFAQILQNAAVQNAAALLQNIPQGLCLGGALGQLSAQS